MSTRIEDIVAEGTRVVTLAEQQGMPLRLLGGVAVRLRCPDGSAGCHGQAPVPAGDGCDETLNWWFSDEARRKTQEEASAAIPPLPILPPECSTLLALPDSTQ